MLITSHMASVELLIADQQNHAWVLGQAMVYLI